MENESSSVLGIIISDPISIFFCTIFYTLFSSLSFFFFKSSSSSSILCFNIMSSSLFFCSLERRLKILLETFYFGLCILPNSIYNINEHNSTLIIKFTMFLRLQIPFCDKCRKSQQLTQCDILFESKCKLTICRKCFKEHEDDICKICKRNLHEHKNKLKNTFKEQYMRTGSRRFEKQFTIRKEWEKYPEVTKQMIHILAFLGLESPKKYDTKYKKQVKDICDRLKEESKVVSGIKDYQYIPQKIKQIKNQDDQYNGKQACGYNSKGYSKGIKQIMQAFSFQN